MAYVITDLCVAVCNTACVDVCPVDAIHGPLSLDQTRGLPATARPQMFIDPIACICCGACESVCPVNAIFDEGSVPARFAGATERNAAFFAKR